MALAMTVTSPFGTFSFSLGKAASTESRTQPPLGRPISFSRNSSLGSSYPEKGHCLTRA